MIVDDIAVGMACLAVGFILGRLSRNVETIATVVAEEGATVTAAAPRRKRWTFEKTAATALIVMGLFTAAQSLYQDSATRRVAECTRAYSNGFADALDARSEANAAAQQALDELMTQVGQLSTGIPTEENRGQFRTALQDYLAKRAEAKKKQQENKFPPAPRDVCG